MTTLEDMQVAEKELDKLQQIRAPLAERKASLESTMTGLNGRVRGRLLLRDEYLSIVKKQDEVKALIKKTDKELVKVNQDIRQWYRIYDQLRIQGRTEVITTSPRASDVDVIAKIKEIRDKYLAFSEDQTRISSMRIVAANVTSDLTSLISEIASDAEN